ncbi:MAG: SGNH/GDSL hydrolase family protein [Dokdonella sp.]|nr:SGNH/GDSL hydrolase family protein [Dokdonella sp.]
MVAAFLALGDSYTIGEGVEVAEAWPLQLATRFAAEGLVIGTPEVIATTGWSTDELAAAIEAARPAAGRALVSLLIGVNNQYRGRDVDNYRDEFSILLDRAIELADGDAARVVVVSIPDWGVTPFAAAHAADAAKVAAELDRFNAIARGITITRAAHWVDVTAISRGAGRDLLAADGLHPSAAQYTLWVEAIAPIARRAWGT